MLLFLYGQKFILKPNFLSPEIINRLSEWKTFFFGQQAEPFFVQHSKTLHCFWLSGIKYRAHFSPAELGRQRTPSRHHRGSLKGLRSATCLSSYWGTHCWGKKAEAKQSCSDASHQRARKCTQDISILLLEYEDDKAGKQDLASFFQKHDLHWTLYSVNNDMKTWFPQKLFKQNSLIQLPSTNANWKQELQCTLQRASYFAIWLSAVNLPSLLILLLLTFPFCYSTLLFGAWEHSIQALPS